MSRKLSLQDFTVRIELPVLWGDMDAFQHVNNIRFFRYFESARIEYMQRIQLDRERQASGIGPILASTSCKYLVPLTFPDTIDIGCRTVVLRRSELEQEYLLVSRKLDKPAALGTAKIVGYDYSQLQRADFPDAILEQIQELDPQVNLELG
ncbi:MAG: acyl-CoA thioesterase [Desulfohalobiaceae bacterium]